MSSTPTPSLPSLDFDCIGPGLESPFPDVRLPNQTGRIVDLHVVRAIRPALVVLYRSAHLRTSTKSPTHYCPTRAV
jgi:hypothetical protein